MSLRLKVPALIVAAAVATAAGGFSAHVPSDGATAILYRDIGFRGPSISLVEPQPQLSLPWPVASIRVGRAPWELCARPGYDGLCTRYVASERVIPAARQIVRSARPLSPDASE